MSFYNLRKWKYINVKGLGIIQGINCPHYNGKTRGVPRRKNFQDLIRKTGRMGIAIDNHCAIEFRDGRVFKVLASKPGAKAYRVFKQKQDVIEEQIGPDESVRSYSRFISST
jgi:hypothetical protein